MIKTVELTNFKSFLELRMNANCLTVLTGLNSGGKSSVLQAIRILFDYVNGINPKRANIKSNLSKDSFYRIQVDDLTLNVYKAGEKQSISIHSTNGIGAKSRTYSYICADRIGPTDIFDLNSSYSDDLGFDGRNVYSFLENHPTAKVNDLLVRAPQNVSLLIPNLISWMSIVSPGFNMRYEMDSSRERAFPYFNDVRPTETGFGLSYVLPVVLSLLISDKDRELLMIENPEAHLHPKGQYELGKLIALSASTGKQIILETHSEHIIDGIRVSVKESVLDSNYVTIYYMYRDNYETPSRVEEIKVNPNGKLDKWPVGFFDQSSISKMELL